MIDIAYKIACDILEDCANAPLETHEVRVERMAAIIRARVDTSKAMIRFAAFNPEEREILQRLIEAHLNTVSQIAVATETRVAPYLAKLEALEAECNQTG